MKAKKISAGAIVFSIFVPGFLQLAQAQGRPGPSFPDVLEAPGSRIGVTVRDLVGADTVVRQGALVDEVRTDSPAEKAGLSRGDVITEFDGETVRSARQFARLVRETPPGRTVRATVLRDGRTTQLAVTSETARPSDVATRIDEGRIRT
jgi:S1-C subfamily serine protease